MLQAETCLNGEELESNLLKRRGRSPDSYPLVASTAVPFFRLPIGYSELEVRLLLFSLSLETVLLLIEFSSAVGGREIERRLRLPLDLVTLYLDRACAVFFFLCMHKEKPH